MSSPIGAMSALITPFKDGKLDTQTYEKLIIRQIESGMDGVVPVGTTGESATLTHSEHRDCIDIAVNVCKGRDVKVLAGAGSNSTSEAVDLAKFAKSRGADGILVVTPYYNKPSQEGLYQHYKAIVKAANIPTMLYNVPSRTGVDLEPSTVSRLFREFSDIYSIKEATGSMARAVELLSKDPKLALISGDDGINYPLLSNGGQGVISVTGNLLPDMISDLTHRVMNGDFTGARDLNNKLYDINSILFCESNPIPIKAAMYLAGLIPTLEYRLPLTRPSDDNLKKIEKVVKQYKIKG
jgi:4-hydroxy-tetrahydrodipicolinate synthase